MWTHLLEVLFSWLAIPAFPLLLLAAMLSAEVLLDRTLHFFHPQRTLPCKYYNDRPSD
jgi:hypothetical protein